jgi:hypothetical protein
VIENLHGFGVLVLAAWIGSALAPPDFFKVALWMWILSLFVRNKGD